MDARGDRLMDFSQAGYQLGATPPMPDSVIPARKTITLSPSLGDDTQRIQGAIDRVSGMPLNSDGFRGMIDLGPGEYLISDSLTIAASGVILRGTGDGGDPATNTILRSITTDPISMIRVLSPAMTGEQLVAVGAKVALIDKVVPAGATSFRVADPAAFKVGQWVNVHREATQEWIDTLGGDQLGWDPLDDRFDQQQERLITRIEGDRLFVNAPIAHSIDSRNSGGTVYRYEDKRTNNVGVEGIRGVSEFDASETEVVEGTTQYVDEDHASSFITFHQVRDAWARDVTGQHLINATVQVNNVSRSITVEDARSLNPVSVVDGGRRYAFNTNGGQFVLMKDLFADQSRHAFVNNSTFGGYNRGPNVFFDSVATNSFNESGSHQRYSTGTLYDNIEESEQLNVQDRGTWGTGHGWSGANYVVWNSQADSFIVQNPPGARNWLIGATSFRGGSPLAANDAPNASDAAGTYDSIGQRVSFDDPDNPKDSLYIAQRLERERFPEVEMREYWVGDFDGLEDDGPGSADEAYVDPDWLAAVDTLSSFYTNMPIAGFDNDSINNRVAFTMRYSLAPGERVVSAVLTISTKSYGSQSGNDKFWIDDISAPKSFPVEQGGSGAVYDGDRQVLTLELTDDLSYLQDGELNLLVADDRAVDWAHLMVYVAPGLPGDFNGDDAVNAADYTVWRDGLGSIYDMDDYQIWQANYGAVAGSSNVPASVPEPAESMLLAFPLLRSAIECMRIRRPLCEPSGRRDSIGD